MCIFGGSSKQAATPAPAPAAPLPDAEDAAIGESRRDENIENFGSDLPSYRVKRPREVPEVTPSSPIQM